MAYRTDRSIPNPVLPPNEPWVTTVSHEEMLADFKGWGPGVEGVLKVGFKIDGLGGVLIV